MNTNTAVDAGTVPDLAEATREWFVPPLIRYGFRRSLGLSIGRETEMGTAKILSRGMSDGIGSLGQPVLGYTDTPAYKDALRLSLRDTEPLRYGFRCSLGLWTGRETDTGTAEILSRGMSGGIGSLGQPVLGYTDTPAYENALRLSLRDAEPFNVRVYDVGGGVSALSPTALPIVVPGTYYMWPSILEPGAVTQRIPFVAAPSAEVVPQEILDRLAYLAGLPPNWDGEGGAPVTQFTVERIKTLLRWAYSATDHVLPIPFISPAHDGMLVAEWRTESGKELILDVPPDETLPGFLLVEPSPSGDEFETDAEIGDEWPIERVILQMLAS